MKKIPWLIAVFCLGFPFMVSAQEKNLEPLRYFISHQGFVGVKDNGGNIVIPAEFASGYDKEYRDGEPVPAGLIYFASLRKGSPLTQSEEPHAVGYLYDRKGKFVCRPFSYDNGPDYFAEGKSRCIAKGKVGFIDYEGKTIIRPQYDFVAPFNYGYAEFCNRCEWVQVDEEHQAIRGGEWGVINVNGETVSPLAQRQTEKDIAINGNLYPYPFSYSDAELKLLEFFRQKETLLSALTYVNYASPLMPEEKKLHFEITAKPGKSFPYYLVVGYDWQKKSPSWSGLTFLVSADMQRYYKENQFAGSPVPFEQWLRSEIDSAVKFQAENPDMPNKFNPEDFLKDKKE